MHRTAVSFSLVLAAVCCAGSASAQQDAAGEHVARGRVVDGQGVPLAGVAVAVFANTDYLTADISAKAAARTGDDGCFAVELAAEADDPLTVHYLALSRKDKAAARRPIRGAGDLGDIALPDGVTLIGAVRREDGRPIAGARVIAADLTRTRRVFMQMRAVDTYSSSAVSDEKGAFVLPSALPTAVEIEFAADGYRHRTVSPVTFGDPLVVSLAEAEVVRGRVVDADGQPVEAAIAVAYEIGSGRTTAQCGADGGFEFAVEYPLRYRVSASAKIDGVWHRAQSEVLAGAQEDCELCLEPPEQKTASRKLRVEAVDRKTRARVAEFTAAAVWMTIPDARIAAAVLGPRFGRSRQAAKDGAVELPGPGDREPPSGALEVRAKGYAELRNDELSWAGDGDSQEIVVELVAESTITGVVLDEDTGEPVKGAGVDRRGVADPNQGAFMFSALSVTRQKSEPEAVTDAKGRFLLKGLGEGEHEVLVTHLGRPDAEALKVTLGAEEQKTGVEIRIPRGATLRGKLTGAAIGSGWRVALAPQRDGARGIAMTASGLGVVPGQGDSVPVAHDGTFELTGLAGGQYGTSLLLPTPPRSGPPLVIPLEPLRIRKADRDEEFDVSRNLPGTIRGKIAVEGSPLPMTRLCVMALPVQAQQIVRTSYGSGPFCFVAEDGGYRLRLAPGKYRLRVLDVDTGVVFHEDSKSSSVEGQKATERDVQIEVVKVLVKLEREAEGATTAADRLEVVVHGPELDADAQAQLQGQVRVLMQGGGTTDSGVGFDLREGPRELTLFVPPFDLDFKVYATDRLANPRQRTTLVEVEHEPRKGEVNELTVRWEP